MTGKADICYLRIDLESDLVLSATSASTGNHETLSHIPGSTLLGVAAKAYGNIPQDLTWSVFHAGGVRFGNAVPLHDGRTYVPRPMTLPWDKADPKGVFIAVDGSRLHPQRRYRRHTAINAATGRPRESTLFGYTSLCAGQSFVSRIEISNKCLPVRPIIMRALTDGPVFLGRSRLTEYGRVRIKPMAQLPRIPTHGELTGTTIRFYAVSDCAFPTGGFPDAAMLGLPDDWRLDPAKSVTGWRRYAPFNRHRGCWDAERIVLEQGSVLAFTGRPLEVNAQARLFATLDGGVGLFVGEGLGVMLAEPRLLATEAETAVRPHAVSDAPAPTDPLFEWLLQRHADSRLGTLVRQQSQKYQKEFARMYRELWREGALTGLAHSEAAPGRAQWGRVRAEASRPVSSAILLHRLFDTSEGVCASGAGAAPWRREVPLRQEETPGTPGGLLRHAMDLSRLYRLLDDERQVRALANELVRRIVFDLATQMPREIDQLEREA